MQRPLELDPRDAAVKEGGPAGHARAAVEPQRNKIARAGKAVPGIEQAA